MLFEARAVGFISGKLGDFHQWEQNSAYNFERTRMEPPTRRLRQ